MRSPAVLSSLLLLSLLNISVADFNKAKIPELQNGITRDLGTSTPPKHPPKPKPSGSSSSSSGSSTSSSTSTSGSTSSVNSIPAPTKASSSQKVMSIAAAGLAFGAAALFQRKRRMSAPQPHPLEGSLAKRVQNFEKFVELPGKRNGNEDMSMGDEYSSMPDTAAMV